MIIPAHACDTHHHIFDPERFPYPSSAGKGLPAATVEDYRQLMSRLDLERNVIVTPSIYGTDNACTLDALKQMGDSARAVVVLSEHEVTDEQLKDMHEAGVRGVRYFVPGDDLDDPEEITAMAGRIAHLGWHLDFWMKADLIVRYKDLLEGLSCPMVFDHRGHLPAEQGIRHPAYEIILALMKEGRAWVKVSALYHDTACRQTGYQDTISVSRAYIREAPGQVIWGTDWPHPSELSSPCGMPDDGELLDALLSQASGDTGLVRQILVDNPAGLYGWT